MSADLVCAECGTPITPAEVAADDLRWHDTEQPYHWACLQEAHERARLAAGGDS